MSLESFKSEETIRLELVRKQLREFNGNIPENIKWLQDDRAKRVEELKQNQKSLWQDYKILNKPYITHKCVICSYSFGDESCSYDAGYMKDFIKEFVTKQKVTHEEICRSGMFEYC